MNIETIKEIVKDNFKDSDLFPLDHFTDEELQELITDNEEDYQDLSDAMREHLEESQGFLDEDVIYYGVAIEYLQEYDASLNESLSLASEMGYSLENLNSEVLASLLKSQNNREEFSDTWSSVETDIVALEDNED